MSRVVGFLEPKSFTNKIKGEIFIYSVFSRGHNCFRSLIFFCF